MPVVTQLYRMPATVSSTVGQLTVAVAPVLLLGVNLLLGVTTDALALAPLLVVGLAESLGDGKDGAACVPRAAPG